MHGQSYQLIEKCGQQSQETLRLTFSHVLKGLHINQGN